MPYTKSYYIYKLDPKETTCKGCSEKNGRIFEEDTVPLLPAHPNCKCSVKKLRDVNINDSYINVIEYREFYDNNNRLLPDSRGRYYMRVYTNNTNFWIVYSNDGLIFFTFDNGKTFNKAVITNDFFNMLDDIKLIYPSKEYESKYNEVIDAFPPYLYERELDLDEKISAIYDIVADLNIDDIESWNVIDAVEYFLDSRFKKSNAIKEKYCEEWIAHYKEVIKIASEMCDIPPELLAGVAWIEVGGMLGAADIAAYWLRGNEKEVLTSFGDLSMQVRRIAEVLRVDINELSEKEKRKLLTLAENKQAQIFLAAQHLSDLRNVDFPGKPGEELTLEDLKVIASRYNIGPDHSYEIALTNEYGERIVNIVDFLSELLS